MVRAILPVGLGCGKKKEVHDGGRGALQNRAGVCLSSSRAGVAFLAKVSVLVVEGKREGRVQSKGAILLGGRGDEIANPMVLCSDSGSP